MTGMRRLIAPTLGIFSLFCTACGPPPAPAELVAFGHMRRADYATVIRERHPDLVAESDRAYDAAQDAWHRGAGDDVILHLTRLARIHWRTAEAKSHTKDLQDAALAAQREREAAERARQDARLRLEVATRDAERLGQLISLRRELTDARQFARLDRKATEARQKLEAAAGLLRQIEGQEVERYAPGPLNRARQSLLTAFEAFNAGRHDEAFRAADLALVDAAAAAAAAAPAWRAEEGQRRLDGELYGMLEEAGRIGPARLEARGLVISVRELFTSGQQVVGQGPKIKAIAAMAKAHPAFRLVIEGHTDNRGSAPRNLALSEARARAVAQALGTAGIDPQRLTPVGRGDQEPVADNATREGRERNRRVEIVFVRPVVEAKP